MKNSNSVSIQYRLDYRLKIHTLFISVFSLVLVLADEDMSNKLYVLLIIQSIVYYRIIYVNMRQYIIKIDRRNIKIIDQTYTLLLPISYFLVFVSYCVNDYIQIYTYIYIIIMLLIYGLSIVFLNKQKGEL